MLGILPQCVASTHSFPHPEPETKLYFKSEDVCAESGGQSSFPSPEPPNLIPNDTFSEKSNAKSRDSDSSENYKMNHAEHLHQTEQSRLEPLVGHPKSSKQTVRSNSHPAARVTSRTQASRSHSYPTTSIRQRITRPASPVDLIEEMYKLFVDYPTVSSEATEPFRTIYPARSVLGSVNLFDEPTPRVSVKVKNIIFKEDYNEIFLIRRNLL